MKPAEIMQRLRYALRSPLARLGLVFDAFLLTALAAILLAYWWPQVRAQQAMATQIEELRRALTFSMQAADMVKAYTIAQQATETVERKLNAPIKQAQLVQALAGMAQRHSVRIVSESYEEGKLQGEYAPLYIQVALQGGYHGVRDFIGDLSALPLWVEVEDARLERLREPAGQIKAQLRLRAIRRATAVTSKS